MKELPKWLNNLDPRIYESNNFRVIDFETSNINKGSALESGNRLICWVGYDGRKRKVHQGYYERSSDNYNDLLEYVAGVDFVVCHNAKFELQWLYRCGLSVGSTFVFDSLVGEYVLAGNRKMALSLEATAGRYGLDSKESIVSSMIKGGVCPSLIPEDRLLDYCKQDVLLTTAIFLEQRKRIIEAGLLPVMYTRCLTTVVLADIERKGMYVDREAVKEEFEQCVKDCKRVMGRLADITGGINPKSPKQVGEFLYDNLGFQEPTDYKGEVIRTPAGGRSTNEETILGLRPVNDKQKEFLECFKEFTPLKKRLETLTKLNECANADKILLARFNQCVTASHRLSSSGGKYKVQFQNIDRDLKRLFVPRHEGWSVGDSDAPQLEFRVAAELGQDDVAKADIRENKDVHRYTASVLLKKPESKVTKAERTAAKSRTFAPLYGASSGTPDEKRYNKAFREKYKALNKTQIDWTFEVLKEKKLRIKSGLIFYWPDTEMFESGYIKNTTSIYNYGIQSYATADIIPITLVYLYYRLLGLDTFIVNTVHDSIICEVAPGEEREWEDAVRDAYTSDVYKYLASIYNHEFSVPLGVSYNLGKYWGDGEEILFVLDPQSTELSQVFAV